MAMPLLRPPPASACASVSLLVVALGLLLLPTPPAAAATPAPTPAGPVYCKGRYAICSSSTCTLTGGTIETKVSTGGVATYPEAICTCPVIKSTFQAYGAVLGQMQGSCANPGKGRVWSMYTPAPRPQAMYNWSTSKHGYDITPLEQLCAGSDAQNPIANCFGFACDVIRRAKGGSGTKRATVATCRCPVGSDVDGFPVPVGTPFRHEAGQCDSSYCAMLPVAVPYGGSSTASQCLGIPPALPPTKSVT